ncbi:Glycerol uptake facilitator protein, partial [Penicillium argentinense]
PAFFHQPTEKASTYQIPSLQNKTISQQGNSISQWPSHSLAGLGIAQPGKVYMDPEYQGLNPRYGKNNEKPIWPLPRVVRLGMRRGDSSAQKAYQPNQHGESEPAPEIGTTPGLSSTRSGAGSVQQG